MPQVDTESAPLFGEDGRQTRFFDALFGVVTIVVVLVTISLSFSLGKVEGIHVFFGVAIILVAAPQLVLVQWFRAGNLAPKFRFLICYQMVSIIMLCVCALVYFYRHRETNCK
eukprot:m.142796 g.142796  ORF g.142796 m.142796 type:complete len:113 (+) comp17147_c0_seq1:2060-2398(+)